MKGLLRASLNIILGVVFGFGFLEAVFHTNPGLLFRGMSLPGPVDAPLTRQSYTVRYSDADVFYWRPDLVRPVARADDQVEAQVDLVTDEFGFRNQPPLPARVDVVVLGRSISLAAHLPQPWPTLLADQTGWQVLNLAQPGGGLLEKIEYLQRYGLPRRPRWVILEIAPSLDIIDGAAPAPALTQAMVYPLIQGLWRLSPQNKSVQPPSGKEIYPLQLDLSERRVDLTCCLHYLEFFSLDQTSLEGSQDWARYRQTLLDLIAALRVQSTCLALLYAPTKPDVYFPLAVDPAQLEPTVREVTPYRLEADGRIAPARGEVLIVATVRQNANAGRQLVQAFAQQNNLPLIDPTQAIVEAVLDGNTPFMVYDSHWNGLGHELVAAEAARVLQANSCP